MSKFAHQIVGINNIYQFVFLSNGYSRNDVYALQLCHVSMALLRRRFVGDAQKSPIKPSTLFERSVLMKPKTEIIMKEKRKKLFSIKEPSLNQKVLWKLIQNFIALIYGTILTV